MGLAGLLAGARLLVEDNEPRWQGDMRRERERALLRVAGGARTARTEAAWRRLVGEE